MERVIIRKIRKDKNLSLSRRAFFMVSFIVCLVLLIVGYLTYGKLVDNTFGPDDRETPAVAINDGVDYVVLPEWKLFMIQLLNIAGLGPIFGAMQGALWGPVVFLWITFGTIFAGGVHDYMSGMLSERNNGESISEVTGKYLGPVMKNIMRAFSVVLLVMVGTVFAVGPAGLLVTLCKKSGASGILTASAFWLAIILIYYFIATFISIDKIIGKIYPVFGVCLIIMAIGVAIGLPLHGYHTPEIFDHFYNMHPSGTPIWSFMFITVACGAISGFHSTQSPLMARCLKSEKQGHFVFYGAMTAEGVIALVWAAAGVSLYETTANAAGVVVNSGLAEALKNGQSAAIYDVCSKTMGGIGIVLAMLGVIACPITSGDTAFRSARLTLADWMGIDQGKAVNRLKLCIPVLGVGAFLGFGQSFGLFSYSVIWRYFSWTNQTLAMIVLWAASMYLVMEHKNYWITAVPATFMSAVSATYFVMAPECLGMIGALKYNTAVAYPVGIIVAIAFLVLFLSKSKKYKTA
jgi:carbon starvation protein CstA